MGSYQDNVQHAATALKVGESANWELARLTFENTLSAAETRRPEQVPLGQWCADVRAASGRRFAESTGQRYRRVWKEAGKAAPGGDLPVWAEAYETILESTRGSLRERLAASDIRQGMQHASPEVKRDAFAQLAADPAIVQEVARMTTPTAQAVGNLMDGAHKIREQQREQRIESDPISKRIDQNVAALDVEAACRRFAADTETFVQTILSLTPRLGQAGVDDRYWITLSVERARAALDRLEVFATTGKSDLDGFLEETLGRR